MSLKVLTVDDSKTIRMIVKKALKPFDCEIFEAENGVEGLALAAREKPGLIVLDITMPVMNGVEMLKKLKAETALKGIPVIMLTAESGKENVLEIVKMGVSDYIVKPFQAEELIERAQKVVKLEPGKGDKAAEEALKQYFSKDGDIQLMALPEKGIRSVLAKVEGYFATKVDDMKNSGLNKFILDLSKVKEVDVPLVKLIVLTIKSCKKAGVPAKAVVTPAIAEQLKGFQETSGISVENSIKEAKEAF
jgi:CheY-like chemotaxis protein/anti-anti-sigma regulatory factor